MQKSLNLFRNLVDWYNGLELPSHVHHPLPGEGNKVSYIVSRKEEKLLFSYSPIHLFTFKKAAFTLAEVLITLAIIGVVAAVTLPTLVQNYQKQVYVTRLRKAISITDNMIKKMQADEGSDFINLKIIQDGVCSYAQKNEGSCEDYYGNPSVFLNIIPKYLNVVKFCRGNSECTIKYQPAYVEKINGKLTLIDEGSPREIGHIVWGGHVNIFYGFYTNDGMIYYIGPGDAPINVFVDINGEKGPNQIGRDLFRYEYLSSGSFYAGYDETIHLIQNDWKMDY